MDKLFESFDNAIKKRRATYQKAVQNEDDEYTEDPLVPPAVLGNGFLFNSSTLDKVKNRLNKDQEQGTQAIDTTQVLSNLYEDGEDLEKEVPSILQSKSKPIPTILIPSIEREILKQPFNENHNFTGVTVPIAKSSAITKNLDREDLESPEIPETQPIPDFSASDVPTQTQVLKTTSETAADTGTVATAAIAYEESLTQVEVSEQTYPDQRNSQEDIIQQTAADAVPITRLKIHEIEEMWSREVQTETKEHKVKYRAPRPLKVFTKEAFMQDFDKSSDSDSDVFDQEIKATSPIGRNNDSISEVGTSDVRVLKDKSSGALTAYQRELKEKAEIAKGVMLLSESDDEEDLAVSTSHEAKATVLKLKARLSKRRPPVESQHGKASLSALMKNLRNSTKRQILDRQKEVIERQGLKFEDVEKEKEIVENLLEQEIARNKRIRMKEKEKAQMNDVPSLALPNRVEEDNDSNYSVSDEDSVIKEDLDYSDLESDDSGSNEPKIASDSAGVEIDSDEDDIRFMKGKAHKISLLNDDESEEEEDLTVNSAINLGAYGDNLITTTKDEAHTSAEEHTTQLVNEISESQYRTMEKEKSKIRAQEEKQRLKQMKESGVTNMFDMEAEESDDEWRGVGGVDGETIDDYDSDLEKMIDDFSNTTSNADQIRQLLMAENKETDLKTVNKILHDIKNGGFRKRRQNNLQLELSDDEDDELLNYKKRKLELMRKRRLQFGADDKKLLKNSRSKAFFESMVEDIIDLKDPFSNQAETSEKDKKSEGLVDASNKQKDTISHEFVQQSLSFLSSSRDFSEFEVARVSQEGERNTDLNSLKQDSTVKTLYAPSNIISESERADHEEFDNSVLPVESSYSSVVKSFGFDLNANDKLKEGRKTVTVSKSYRTVGGNKASITYLGKMRKLVAPKKSNAEVRTTSKLSTLGNSKIFRNFESSFEN